MIGATRSTRVLSEDERPVALGGLIGTAAQTVDRTRPLRLRWYGGKGPFTVDLATADGASSQHAATGERTALLAVSGTPAGRYTLTITAANGKLVLPVTLVDAAAIPAAPGIEAAASDNDRELLQASWMLTRAPTALHLDALSRLETQALDPRNIIAGSIVTPSGQSDTP